MSSRAGGSSKAGGGGAKSGEHECVIFCVATQGMELARQRVQSLCDDGCVRVPELHVRESVWTRKNTERGPASGLGNATEIRVRTTCGDLVQVGAKAQVCAAGQPALLPRVDQDERIEVLHYNLFQLAHLKSLETPVRTMLRIGVAGDVVDFLTHTGFQRAFEVNYSGERILTREGIEIDLFRRTKAFKSPTFLVPEGCASVEASPLILTFRAIASSDADIERTAKRLRTFVNEIKVGVSVEEVRPNDFLGRMAIR